MKNLKKMNLLAITILGFTVGCGNEVDPNPKPNPIDPDEPNNKENIFDEKSLGLSKDYSTLKSFLPTKFDEDSLKKVSEDKLNDGVNHIIYSFNLNNGNNVKANIIEVDISKAKIDTEYSTNGVDRVYTQMKKYEENNNKKVYAIMNADFFATGVGTSVNAYVNNDCIVKSKHNDKGIYDYTNLDADIPASKPQLFGIANDKVKISPVINNGTIEQTIKAEITYKFLFENDDKEVTTITDSITSNEKSLGNTKRYNLITNNMDIIEFSEGDYLYKIKKESSSTFVYGTVQEIKKQKIDGSKVISDADEYFYVLSKEDIGVIKGNRFGYTIHTSDETFDFYHSVVGGRQSLVENGEIAPTVSKENSNGAQTTNIPRTCVGVKDETHVVLCTIEALRYGNKSTSEEDSYGVNLPELADFMRYIGCYDAMNFDGGGSTQLITTNANGEKEVKVRSSDSGTYELDSGRKVYNTILVTGK